MGGSSLVGHPFFMMSTPEDETLKI